MQEDAVHGSRSTDEKGPPNNNVSTTQNAKIQPLASNSSSSHHCSSASSHLDLPGRCAHDVVLFELHKSNF